jgi:hypothetical protein
MKSVLIAAAVIALTTAASLSPASAEGPRASSGNTVPQTAATAAPHYEWQYGYVGRHARYQGHWVLVQ